MEEPTDAAAGQGSMEVNSVVQDGGATADVQTPSRDTSDVKTPSRDTSDVKTPSSDAVLVKDHPGQSGDGPSQDDTGGTSTQEDTMSAIKKGKKKKRRNKGKGAGHDITEDDITDHTTNGVTVSNSVEEQKSPGTQGSDDEDSIDLSNAESLDGPGRNTLFVRAKDLQSKGKNELSLKCYLGCLRGLEENSGFMYVPQCLHNVADLYYAKEEYENAVQFIQAEKMYYETALIDTTKLQQRVEQKQKRQESGEAVDKETSLDVLKAQEYEDLARLCLDRNQPQLALEYAGKATKIRQHALGPNHSVTTNSLDFFTAIFAEVGKEQYTESMNRYRSEMPAQTEGDLAGSDIRDIPVGDEVPLQSSTLRQRGRPPKTELQKEQISREEFSAQKKRVQEEMISASLLWVLFFICLSMLCVLLTMLYCSLFEDSDHCRHLKSHILHYSRLAKYYLFPSPKTSG